MYGLSNLASEWLIFSFFELRSCWFAKAREKWVHCCRAEICLPRLWNAFPPQSLSERSQLCSGLVSFLSPTCRRSGAEFNRWVVKVAVLFFKSWLLRENHQSNTDEFLKISPINWPHLDDEIKSKWLWNCSFLMIYFTFFLSLGRSKDCQRQPTNLKCPACGRSYAFRSTLLRHFRYECFASAVEPQFLCPICPARFKRNERLKYHMEHTHGTSQNRRRRAGSVAGRDGRGGSSRPNEHQWRFYKVERPAPSALVSSYRLFSLSRDPIFPPWKFLSIFSPY